VDTALKLNPSFWNTYVVRGLIYHEERNHFKALLDFNRVIELNPDFLNAYFYRGMTFYHLDRFDEAIKDFSACINRIPGPDEFVSYTYFLRSECYEKKEEYQKALADADMALKLNPDLQEQIQPLRRRLRAQLASQ
jgi:tetratricopeptide (TPR) repeat protein